MRERDVASRPNSWADDELARLAWPVSVRETRRQPRSAANGYRGQASSGTVR